LKSLAPKVQRAMGAALRKAQSGGKSDTAKILRGFGSGKVLEIVDNFNTDTFRAVYTVQFAQVIYVLHVFQKKSHESIKTDKSDIDLINKRLQAAKADYELNFPAGAKKK